MTVTAVGQMISSGALQSEANVQRQLRARLVVLGASTGFRFSVVRDAATQRFVVQVVEPNTGNVIDQFPAESILKRLQPKN